MSVSKPKRASFRIDDILSIKTSSSDDDDDTRAKSCAKVNTTDYTSSGEAARDNARILSSVFQDRGFQINPVIANSHSSLLQALGNRKRKRDEFERSLARAQPVSDRQLVVSDVDKHSTNNDDERLSPSTDHAVADDTTERYYNNNRDKLYPLVPRATKLPTSLESLMRTQHHDYLLKYPAALSPWGLLTNRCLAGFPPGFGLSLNAAQEPKNCICGSPNCVKHRSSTEGELNYQSL